MIETLRFAASNRSMQLLIPIIFYNGASLGFFQTMFPLSWQDRDSPTVRVFCMCVCFHRWRSAAGNRARVRRCLLCVACAAALRLRVCVRVRQKQSSMMTNPFQHGFPSGAALVVDRVQRNLIAAVTSSVESRPCPVRACVRAYAGIFIVGALPPATALAIAAACCVWRVPLLCVCVFACARSRAQ